MQISLVVPIRNEEETIGALVDSIRAQNRPPDEVVFVDGGSTDRTVARARELTAGDSRFEIIEAGDATPGRGRNVGIAAAQFDWIALTDAGIRLETTWLERLVEVVERDDEVKVVYGNYEPVGDSFFERCAALAYVIPKQQRDGARIRGPFIASSLLRREVWKAAGGFPDLRAAEDLIFMERIREMGFRTGWAANATAWWKLQQSFKSTFRKFVLYSKHNVWVGRQWDWHYGITRQYLIALVFLILAIVHSPWWLAVVGLGLIARTLKNIWRKREAKGLLWTLNPLRVACVAAIILTVDLATFVGWAQAIFQRPANKIKTQAATSGEIDR